MIDAKIASRQIERLKGLNFFPTEAPALKELRLAAECAASEAILVAAVGSWLGDTSSVRKDSGELASTSCPKPAELRRILYGLNEQHNESLTKCRKCGGAGANTVWRLVTYKGAGNGIERSEAIPDARNNEMAMAFARQVADYQRENPNALRQMVVSAAELCECRRGQ